MKNTWVAVTDALPKPLQTVWLTNGKGWVCLGCLVESDGGWHWAESNGVIYIENGEIVSECESEDCPLFSLDELVGMLTHIDLSIDSDFWGFGVEQDIKMLAKYGWHITINDIRTHFQKTEFAYRMATGGSGLEPTYLIVTSEYPPTASHADFSEMILIEKLFEKMKEYEADTYMSVVPFGHCSGMLISDYVQEYRRQSDGYRYNNSDAFASALSNAIEQLEYADDDFDDEDW